MRKIVGIYLSIRSSFKLINLRGKFDMNKCYKSSFTILKMCKYILSPRAFEVKLP